MKAKLNAALVYDLARQVAETSNVMESDHEDEEFDRDPELWIVGFFLAALERMRSRLRSSGNLRDTAREASYEHIQKEAWKLLKRKGHFEPVVEEMSPT